MADIFQERLLYAMKIRGYSQSNLSKISGLSKPLICKYTKGEYKASNTNLVKLSNALKVNPGWLLGLSIDMESTTPQKNNDLIDEIVELINYQDKETLEKILSMIKLMIK